MTDLSIATLNLIEAANTAASILSELDSYPNISDVVETLRKAISDARLEVQSYEVNSL